MIGIPLSHQRKTVAGPNLLSKPLPWATNTARPISEHTSHVGLQTGRNRIPKVRQFSDGQTQLGMAAYLPTGLQLIAPARPESSLRRFVQV